jgi:lipoyl(octanoyl) transferase
MVDLLERVEALLELEGNSYQTIDYLSPAHQQRVLNGFYFNNNSIASVVAMGGSDLQSAFAATCSSSTNSSSHSGINEVWRERICEWSYQVIDHFDFSREVVSISTHYLDRVLAKTHVNKKLFQLVAMTSLYLAIKIYEPGTLNISSMIELSRGYFSPEQMAEMEMAILRYVLTCCSWRNKRSFSLNRSSRLGKFPTILPPTRRELVRMHALEASA